MKNYPEGQVENVELINNPEDESMGKRLVPFSREVYIEQDDFMETPPNKFFRLAPGMEVRLKGAYIIKCESFKKNETPVRLKRYIAPTIRVQGVVKCIG